MKWHWYDWAALITAWVLWLSRQAVLHGYLLPILRP